MSFRFRKSINFGFFRINLSSGGIGFSWGVRGLRFGTDARGRSYRTITVPGTGFSETKYGSTSHKTFRSRTKRRLSIILFLSTCWVGFCFYQGVQQSFSNDSLHLLNQSLIVELVLSLAYGIVRFLMSLFTSEEQDEFQERFEDAA